MPIASQIKTAAELRGFIEERGSSPHFFDRKTMAFFGDKMANYGVRKTDVPCRYDAEGNYVAAGVVLACYELFRKRPVKNGLQDSTFWHAETFKQVYPASDTHVTKVSA